MATGRFWNIFVIPRRGHCTGVACRDMNEKHKNVPVFVISPTSIRIGFMQVKLSIPILLLLLLGVQERSHAQVEPDLQQFRMLSAGRDRFIHDAHLENLDSASFLAIYKPFLEIAEEKKDERARWLLRFNYFQQRRRLKLSEAANLGLLSELEQDAKQQGLKVEETVAHHFAIFERYNAKQLPQEQLYVEILQEFERMEELGFEKFRDFDIARMLFHSGWFMYDLDDFEKALQCLTVAEHFVEPTVQGHQTYTLVLNHIQTIYQKQKNYDKGIEYAQKVLQFSQHLQTADTAVLNQCQLWQGIASIDIASMLVEQGKFAEGETYANEGYKLVRADVTRDVGAEYDALQVLISTKLELGKLQEAATLLHRVDEINQCCEQRLPSNHFRHIRFYQSYARYFEIKGDSTAAYRYASLAAPLKDSLDRRNDARKLEKIKQRLDAEKYTSKLKLVESEKQLQTWLRNGAIFTLLLVGALALVNFRRLRHKRQLAILELETAKKDLELFTSSLREKSELAENLRLENEKLARSGERSEYLEKLTRSTILTEEDWAQFRSVFEKVHPDFLSELKSQYPDLTPAETRLLVLEKLDLNLQEMANMLGVSKNTIHQTRYRLRRKTDSSTNP